MAEKIQFYPLDIQYKVIDDNPVILIFGKTLDGSQICLMDHDFLPYFLVIVKDNPQMAAEKIAKLETEDAKVVKTEIVSMKMFGKPVQAIKVFCKIPAHVPKIRQIIKEWEHINGIYEYDILFTRRYLIDKEIIPLTLTEAEGEIIGKGYKVPCMKISSIKNVSEDILEKPKVLAFDIETYNPPGRGIDTEQNPIIMLAVYGRDIQKVIAWKLVSSDECPIEYVKSEAELIERFKEILESYKPDFITGYFSDKFDLPYIKDRAKKYKIKLDLGLDHSDLKIDRKRDDTAEISGIVHLDMYKFIRKVIARSMSAESFSLNSVASELLGEKKNDVELDNLYEVWDNHDKEALENFCKYNLQDALLCYKLFDKVYSHLIEVIKVTGQSPFTVSRLAFSQLVEWYLLRQAHLFKEIAPNKPSHFELGQRRMQSYSGGFVYEPKPGFFKNVAIFDFRSLYPSIISSHNIDISTLNAKDSVEDGRNRITLDDTGETFWFSTKTRGFLSSLIGDIITRRSRVKEILKEDPGNALLEARQQSLKLLANSFYGYLGFAVARWYSLECAKAITGFGRYHIKRVIHKAKEKGFSVLYSDTDSVFLQLGKKTEKDALAFMDEINQDLPGIMELEYEGFFPSALFVSAKDKGAGAKKRYAILDDEGRIKIKGFESVRRNFSKIGKEIQEKVIEIILKENDKEKALLYVKEKINELKNHEVPVEKMVISTQLTRDIKSYDNIGPHVAIAQQMIDKGQEVKSGSIIKYVITKGAGRIRDKAKLPEETSQDEYDYEYYLNNQILPAVEKIFEVLGYTKEDIVSEKNQKKLESFFG